MARQPAGPRETLETELETGKGMTMPAGVHVVENVGEDDIEIIFLEVGAQAGETPTEGPCYPTRD